MTQEDFSILSDLELVDKIKTEDCNNSLKELISRHTPLCYSIYHKYKNKLQEIAGWSPYDIYTEKDLIIYQVAKSFNSEKKTKFSTWLGNHIRYYCLHCLNKNNRHVLMEDKELNTHVENRFEDTSIKENTHEYIFNILEQLKDERIKTIYKLRYFGDGETPSWMKIGENLNISRQTVINLHRKAQKFLKNKLTSNKSFDVV